MMVGESVSMEIRKQEAARTEKPLLEVRSLVCRDAEGRKLLDGAGFGLFGGEILGVAGIAGSGQKELCEAIAGLRKVDGGEILLNGENIAGLGPRAVRNKGLSMGFVPEDRLGMGLVAGMSVTDNILLRSYDKLPGLFVDRKAGRGKAEEIVKTYSVSTPSVNHPVRKLSGGNIQKVLLGREIGMEPQVLITAYPVRGLDIGASLAIYGILNEQKKRGVAVLFIGEDLDVLRELCDRIMVMHEGRVTGIVDPGTSTKEALGLLMLGHKAEAA
jgi:simple sugar transport system ATP-binding protein